MDKRANSCAPGWEVWGLNIYLAKGELDVALTLFTQILHADPGNPWVFNNLGLELPAVSLVSLAIEALDQGLKRVKKNDPHKLKGQFKELRDEAGEELASVTDRVEEVNEGVLAEFQKALYLPPETKNSDNEDHTTYPPQVARLMENGVEYDNTQYDNFLYQGRAFIPALIQLAYNKENKNGSDHSITVLQILYDQYPAELLLLAPWLDQAKGDWQLELLSSGMGKVGGFSSLTLQVYAADDQYDNFIRAAATDALVERVARFPVLKKGIVAFFRTLLTRLEAYEASEENFVARVISDIINLDARDLYPVIKQVFYEHRLESGWIELDDVHRKWDLPRIMPQRRMDGLLTCHTVKQDFTIHIADTKLLISL